MAVDSTEELLETIDQLRRVARLAAEEGDVELLRLVASTLAKLELTYREAPARRLETVRK
jgi:hypothetical protein